MDSADISESSAGRPAGNPPAGHEASLVDAIEARLLQLLEQPHVVPGIRLPTERALAQEYGVSRNVVRRAFAKLEARGKVIRVIGSGTYVAEPKPPEAATSAGPKDYSPQEIMQARMIVEPRFAGLIVMHANGADIDAIGAAMREAERAESFEQFEYWDGHFHQVLADATHNRLIVDLYNVITHSRETVEWGELKKGSLTPERRQKYQVEHREIFEALQARNSQRAEVAIRTHLAGIHEALFGL